jgi:pilus assembly protein Flp/PilA
MVDAFTSVVVRAQNTWFALRNREDGQGLVEYALIIALVGLAAIVALGFLSTKINTLFSKAGNSLNNVPVPPGTP